MSSLQRTLRRKLEVKGLNKKQARHRRAEIRAHRKSKEEYKCQN